MFDDIDGKEFTASSSNQLVHVVLKAGQVRSVQISRSIIQEDAPELMEQAVTEAINQVMNDYLDAISERLMDEGIIHRTN